MTNIRRANQTLPLVVPQRTASPTIDSLPLLVAAAGPAAQFAFEEFFYGRIRNPHNHDQTQEASQFGLTDLLAVAKVADMAFGWVHEQQVPARASESDE